MTTPATVPVLNATMAATLVGKDITRYTSSSTSETSSSTEIHNRITSDGRIAATYEYSFSGPLGSVYKYEEHAGQWWIYDSGLTGGRYWAKVAVYWYDSNVAGDIGTIDTFTIATSDGVDFTIDDAAYASTAIADVTGAGADTIDSSSTATLGPTLLGKGGNDVLIGRDDHQNQIFGGDGNDRLEGRGGDDTLYGQMGNDTLDGGAGVDLAFLFSARDQFTVTPAGGGAYLVTGPEGSDRLVGIEYLQFDTAAPVAIETLVSTGPTEGNDTLTGTAAADRIDGLGGDDSLSGLAGDDTLIGGAGLDTLDGGAGADSMSGGAGDDTYVVDDAADQVVEAAAGGADRVTSTVTLTLPAEVEQLTLAGTAAIHGTGNALANRLSGNAAANTLSGAAGNDTLEGQGGNDTLHGGAGADSMAGGAGNDAYIVDDAGDRVVEAAGGGTDRVTSSVAFTLGAEVENLTLSGTAAVAGTGNALANRVTGNGAANNLRGMGSNDTLAGQAGNDTLNGGLGADSMTGGAGNDLYVVDDAGDKVIEAAGGGADRVSSSLTHTLAAQVERLTLTGTAAINGTGNALPNLVVGNGAANVLDGAGGADTLTGGAGADVFVLGSAGAADTIKDFTSGVDHLRVSQAAFAVGDGDTVVEGAVARGAPGGFAPTAELVVFTSNIAGGITAASAAAKIGSATAAWAVGQRSLFMVDNGSSSALFLFTAADADALVTAGELQLLATLSGTASTTPADLLFGA